MQRIVLDIEDGLGEYLLDQFNVDDQGTPITSSLRVGNSAGIYAEFVEEGYLIDNLEDKLKKIRDSFQALESKGFTKKVLEAYVRSKGITKTEFDRVMGAVNEFFRQLD